MPATKKAPGTSQDATEKQKPHERKGRLGNGRAHFTVEEFKAAFADRDKYHEHR
jgi:hypothetical protein